MGCEGALEGLQGSLAGEADGKDGGEWGGGSIPCLSFASVFRARTNEVLKEVGAATVGKQGRPLGCQSFERSTLGAPTARG